MASRVEGSTHTATAATPATSTKAERDTRQNHTPQSRLVPLLREINDLKRIRVAGRHGSLAEQLFLRAWGRIVAGEDFAQVALGETARAVVAARLAGIDAQVLRRAGLAAADARTILARGLEPFAAALDAGLLRSLRRALDSEIECDTAAPDAARITADHVPEFVTLLAAQPRAGATRPDHARVVLEPTENHAEHCAGVAVYAVLFAPLYDADPAQAFLAGLAHHLHNARLPDAGYAGDELVGEYLPGIMDRFREIALNELPAPLRDAVREAISHTSHADTTTARAFQAADVLDRVLEMDWHARSASFTLSVALDEMDIVHPGAVQRFHQQLLREAGLS